MANTDPSTTDLIAALAADKESTRLKAALAAGIDPNPALIDTLITRCAIEPAFFVRDMLTWALIRLPPELTVPALTAELQSGVIQARSQALHTLSKIKDPGTWPLVTQSLLRDPDDEVAKAAWRAAVILVPEGQQAGLAEELATHFGRGPRETQLSLSRSLIALGEEGVAPVLQWALASADPVVAAHAKATEQLLREPDAGSQFAVDQVKRMFAPGQ
jgi:HEAT repeat protein